MIITQTADSIRRSIKTRSMVFLMAPGLLGFIAFLSVTEGPFIRGIVTLSMTLPCFLFGVMIWMRGKRSDDELLRNRKEISFDDEKIEIRIYKGGAVKSVKSFKVVDVKGYRKVQPYLMIKTGLLSEQKVLMYEYEDNDIGKLTHYLDGLTNR